MAGMNRQITLVCTGVPPNIGANLAIDVVEEFTHRPWHQNVTCQWDGVNLILCAENDWDDNGKALLDEFSDAICANVDGFDGDISIRSITALSINSN